MAGTSPIRRTGTLAAAVAAAAVVLVMLVGTVLPGARAATPAAGPTTGQTLVTGDVPPGTTFTQVAGGVAHSVGLTVDGQVYTWGRNNVGQLGDGTTTDSSTPVAVPLPAGSTWVAVAAGNYFSAALSSDGQVYTWGSNPYGQLGDGSTTSSLVPVAAPVPAGVTLTGLSAGYFHVAALTTDGTMVTWGYNSMGQLADGTTTNALVPQVVAPPEGVTFTTVLAAGYHTIALGSDGQVYGWGDNRNGQLGDGTLTSSSAPVTAALPDGVTATVITTGYDFTVAAGSDGGTYSWGAGSYGQLGTGSTASSLTPALASTPEGVTFTTMSSGEYYTLATASDGTTYGWGRNDAGQLGLGSTSNTLVPTALTTPAGLTFGAYATAYAHAFAIGSDGGTYGWGSNTYGQLGDGTTTTSTTPLLVAQDDVQVLEVAFGGVAGTALAQADGTWSVRTPQHDCGTVDVLVTVQHSFGSAGTATLTDGTFTFGTAPVVTEQPVATAQVPADGGEVSVTAAADGDLAPTVQWQQTTADGDWVDVPGATDTSLTLTVTTATSLRAVFTNCLGTATTDVTAVTLAAPEPEPTPDPAPTVEPTPDPAPTVEPTTPATPGDPGSGSDGSGSADGGSTGTTGTSTAGSGSTSTVAAVLARTGAIGIALLLCAGLGLIATGVVLRRSRRQEG
jgi:alpha-tubulin suppressor-like RCC1 family protein